jgi:hypothetical protein
MAAEVTSMSNACLMNLHSSNSVVWPRPMERARIWEMNHRGLTIIWRYKDNSGKPTHNTIYRLTTPLQQVDFEKCCLKEE